MDFKRNITAKLVLWKKDKNRKPLILRGARQVGKTYLIKQFSKTFKHQIFLNLEKQKDVSYFNETDDVKQIVEILLLKHKIPLNNISDTLLFIDEIQESPKVIQLLRYFYEDLPKLHVIAAGSLLEFAMRYVKSFPVGRVDYLYLNPMNFLEFLNVKNNRTLEEINKIPIAPFAHSVLLDLFNTYILIGGMPEVVKKYIETDSLVDLPKIFQSIWFTYKNDIEKYATNETDRKVIKHIVNVAHLLIDKRIKFQNFGNSNYKSREVSEALSNLNDARIIQLIYPTTVLEPPIISDYKKSPKLQFLDTGLIINALQLQSEMLGINDLSNLFKGAIIPHIIIQELMSLNNFVYKKPNFWVREKKQASSEINLVYQQGKYVIPIEIKAGKTGTLKSLHQFVNRTNHPYAVRIFAGEFLIEKIKTPEGTPYLLMNLPYYLGTKIPEYVNYFIKNHKL